MPRSAPLIQGGIGGTGIVGILTEFGSLIVASRRVATDGQTTYSDGFGDVRASDITIGDSLTVEAGGRTDMQTAQRVHVTHPLVGEITAIANSGRELTILETTVKLSRPIVLFGSASAWLLRVFGAAILLRLAP